MTRTTLSLSATLDDDALLDKHTHAFADVAASIATYGAEVSLMIYPDPEETKDAPDPAAAYAPVDAARIRAQALHEAADMLSLRPQADRLVIIDELRGRAKEAVAEDLQQRAADAAAQLR